jgi:hypothetical protein
MHKYVFLKHITSPRKAGFSITGEIMEKGERKGFALPFICIMRGKGYFTV